MFTPTQKFKIISSATKVMGAIFWDINIILVNFFEILHTINTAEKEEVMSPKQWTNLKNDRLPYK